MHVADDLTRLIETAIDTACKVQVECKAPNLLGYSNAEVVGQHVVSASPENSPKPLWESARIGTHWEGGSNFYSLCYQCDERRDISLNAYSAWTQG